MTKIQDLRIQIPITRGQSAETNVVEMAGSIGSAKGMSAGQSVGHGENDQLTGGGASSTGCDRNSTRTIHPFNTREVSS